MKRLLAIIGCAILLAVVCIQLYSRYINRDMHFFLRAANASDAWAEHIQAGNRPVYVMTGGSEIRSGVNPQIMLDEFGIPLVNASGAAGHGLQANAAAAFKYLKPGDTLVLSILSTIDTNIPPSASGVKINVYRQGLAALDSGMIEPSLESAGKFLSSDVRDMFVLLMRYFGHLGRLYKYDWKTVIHPSGWMEIQYREIDSYMQEAPKSTRRLVPLADESLLIQTLQRLQSYCEKHGIHLIASLPVECMSESYRAQTAMNALGIVRLGIPVLKDERLGCLPDPRAFADTMDHLNAEGAAENTRILARLLRDNIFWTEEELEAALHSMEWNADGTPANQHAIP